MNLLRPLILITPCIIPWLLWTCLRISYPRSYHAIIRKRKINYYYYGLGLACHKCDRFRCNEITNLTMRDIEDLGSAIVEGVRDSKNYKSRSFTILGKFYV
jgi:hypothetical protein